MLTLFISKLSTVSMATVDKIVEAILNEYRNTHQDEELIGDYGVHATNIAYTVVEAIVLEFIQQLNSGATNFTLDEFEVALDDDWEAIYASGEPVDDEFVGFVGRWLLDPAQMEMFANEFESPYSEAKAFLESMEGTHSTPHVICIYRRRFQEMLLEGTIRFGTIAQNEIEWSPEKVPFVVTAGSMFSEHEFLSSDYPVVLYNGRIMLLDPEPSYSMIPIHAEVTVGRLSGEARRWMERDDD